MQKKRKGAHVWVPLEVPSDAVDRVRRWRGADESSGNGSRDCSGAIGQSRIIDLTHMALQCSVSHSKRRQSVSSPGTRHLSHHVLNLKVLVAS
jgi:hypothetical protein